MTVDKYATPSTIISQTGYGEGDNIGGNKYVNIYKEIAPKALHTPIEKILNFVKNKEVDKAGLLLDTLKSMGSLDNDTLALLDIISVRINIVEQTDLDNAYQSLIKFHQSKPKGLAADLCIGTLIRLDVINDKSDIAKERYQQISSPESYTNEAYYELVAEASELKGKFKDNRLYLTELDLCSLVRGGLRLKLYQFTLQVATELVHNHPSFNSRVLLLIAKAAILSFELGSTHYWFISNQLKLQLESLTEELIDLVEESNGEEERLIPTVTSIHQYTLGQSNKLDNLSLKYIDKLERLQPDIAKIVKLANSDVIESGETGEDRILKAQKDPKYKLEAINKIISKSTITVEEAAILATIGDKSSISLWLDNEPNISCDDEFDREFILLELKALSCNNYLQAKHNYETIFESFLASHKEQIGNINPFRVYSFSQKLMDLELFPSAVNLLSSYILTDDPWPSPPVKLYLNALEASAQFNTLNSVLFSIKSEASDFFIWQFKGVFLSKNDQLDAAKEAFQNAIKINPDIAECWYNLISCLKLQNANDEQLRETINKIPNSLLDEPSQLIATILGEGSKVGLFSLAEETMISWFAQAPENNAIVIVNLFSSLTIFRKNEVQLIEPRSYLPDGTTAFKYFIDGKPFFKLVTFKDYEKSSHILSHDSPLGAALLNMSVGETVSVGTQEIRLLEKIPPLVAAYQISLQLRHTINDGSDCFDMFESPDDVNELVALMKKKMQTGEDDRKFIATHNTLPLLMKCKRLNSSDPVDIALNSMSSPEVTKHPLFDGGVSVSDSLVLDLYGIIYLALTGLNRSSELSKYKIYITEETAFNFEQWFNRISDPEYLVAGVNSEGEFYRVTAEDIQQKTKSIQKAVSFILDQTEILKANLVDLPPSLLKIKDLISASAYSSIVLSIANDIPWLCIDGQLSQFYSALGQVSINAQQFLLLLANSTEFEFKKYGVFYHIDSGLPYPLTYEDMFQLSESKDEIDLYHLAELLGKYANIFESSDKANQFAYKILIPVLGNSCADGEILNGLRVNNINNNGLAERIFFTCCRIVISPLDEKVAEEKLAKLLTSLTLRSQKTPTLEKLILVLFHNFILGHFLSFSAVQSYSNNILSNLIESRGESEY